MTTDLANEGGSAEAAGSIGIDTELVELTQYILEGARYSTERVDVAQGVSAVLGENLDNVVIALATVTVSDLVRAEPFLSRLLVERMSRGEAQGKRWDGYVVLLTAQRAENSLAEALFGVTYNLRQVRRIARVGVETTMAGVTRALRPVLPLTSLSLGDVAQDPLGELEKRLLADGLDPTSVRRALARFKTEHPSDFARQDNFAADFPDAEDEGPANEH